MTLTIKCGFYYVWDMQQDMIKPCKKVYDAIPKQIEVVKKIQNKTIEVLQMNNFFI